MLIPFATYRPSSSGSYNFNANQRKALLGSAHIEGHLQRVNELFESLRDDGDYGYNTALYLLMNMDMSDAIQVRLLNAYKDDYGDRYDDWREATKLGADLVAKGITVLGDDDRIATLPAHIEANEVYENAVMLYDLETWDGPDNDIINYADNTPYAATVEKHAKDIDKIIEYRGDLEKKDSRGYRDAIKGAAFDVGAFEEYLSLGILGDGAL